MENSIYHALGLHMHQPPGNLKLLIETNEWEAKQIILCYQRPLKYAKYFEDIAYFHVGFSGILLEQLIDKEIIDRYRHILDIPKMLDDYRNANNIEFIGMGYFHPIFPLVPTDDWKEQLDRGKDIMKDLFGKEPVGFWPPEMAFSMEMIPILKKNGYNYIVVDSVHVKPKDLLEGEDIIYQPHIVQYDGVEMVVIPRDRDLSNAQESGLDSNWFNNEVLSKTGKAKRPCLVTTWSDGENGGWFRQLDEGAGFWGHYFAPYMAKVRNRDICIRPKLMSDYIREHKPKTNVEVEVHTGAWNVGSRSGYDFSQWAGSDTQRKAMRDIWEISKIYHQSLKEIERVNKERDVSSIKERLKEAYNLILRSQTSCYFFWGDSWIPRVYENIIPAKELIEKVRRELSDNYEKKKEDNTKKKKEDQERKYFAL
ncbi:MAG: glycoside hydrolase family 57 [Nitrospinae bacterium]|nr:glycoside hydrolase family 57 [Nitrospinota bacterium]